MATNGKSTQLLVLSTDKLQASRMLNDSSLEDFVELQNP